MLRLLLIAIFLFVGSAAIAAPFIVSDPWPYGGLQPDTCTATEQPGPLTRDLDLFVGGAGQKSIQEDIADSVPGTHTWSIVCWSNTGGILPSPPVEFTFSIGVPLAAPTGLRIVP